MKDFIVEVCKTEYSKGEICIKAHDFSIPYNNTDIPKHDYETKLPSIPTKRQDTFARVYP
jgi:hypothetical protein